MNNFSIILICIISILCFSQVVTVPIQSRVTISAQKQTLKCKQTELFKSSIGCLKLCTQEMQTKCSQVFMYLTKGNNVCAYYTSSDKPITFQDQCNSCQIAGVIGYKNGKCSISEQATLFGSPVLDINWIQKLPGILVCQQNYFYTNEKGCIKSCNHPDFFNCPNMFIMLYNPKFCALGKNNLWTSYTFDCQACGKYTDNMGVADGPCFNPIILNKINMTNNNKPVRVIEDPVCNMNADCTFVEQCKSGKCVFKTTTCQKSKDCLNGAICTNKICNYQDQGKKVCPLFPDVKNCPDLRYFMAPIKNICVLDQNDKYYGFVRDCQICLTPQIKSYRQTVCQVQKIGFFTKAR